MDPKYADLFDIPGDITYLNCATLSPQLKAVTAAGIRGLQRKIHPWEIESIDWFTGPEQVRALAGSIINADAESMALVSSVSYGVSIAAANIPVKRGQQIIVLDKEYPSNYYSWNELAKTNGAEMVTVAKGNNTWTAAILQAINEHTAVVAVPVCNWTNGALIDLEQVGRKARSVGAALVVDASQSMGAYPIDVAVIQPDFLVAVGYKWLLGPYGFGYLYAAPKYRDTGKPIEYTWLNKKGSEDFTNLVNYRDDFRPGARRFDMGGISSFIHTPMAIAALTQILEWGVPTIQAKLSSLTQKIAHEAGKLGLGFPEQAERVDHLIGLDLPGGVSKELKAELKKENIYVAFRGERIRVSPYVHNSNDDVDKFFEVLRRHI